MIFFITYALLSTILVLTAIGTYISVHHLSLPQETLTILTIALPPLAFLHTILAPLLLRRLPPHSSPLLPPTIMFPLLNLLQLIGTVILATLLFSLPSNATCSLSAKWQSLYAAKDATHIKDIQETLHCCGFRTVRDRAWPFDQNGGTSCTETFGFTQPCAGPWAAAAKKDAVVAGIIVLLVGLMQGGLKLIAQWKEAKGDGGEHRGFTQYEDYERGGERRPLLEGERVREEEDDERVATEDTGAEIRENGVQSVRHERHRLILPGQGENVWREGSAD